VRLTTSHRKTLLLWNLNRGGQGPIWAVASLDGWMDVHTQARIQQELQHYVVHDEYGYDTPLVSYKYISLKYSTDIK
jgi:hypothetical protein